MSELVSEWVSDKGKQWSDSGPIKTDPLGPVGGMIVDGKAQETCNLNSAILVSIVHVFFFLSNASITPSKVSWETYLAQHVIYQSWKFHLIQTTIQFYLIDPTCCVR